MRGLVAYSWPLFVGNLLQVLYSVIDSIWVGHFLGPEALAAVTIGFPIIFTLVAIAIGFAMAVTILISQYFGAKQEAMVEKVIKNSLFLMLLIGAVISIAGLVFNRPLLQLIATPESLLGNASLFLQVFFSGIIFFFGLGVINAILMGLGDSTTPVKFQAIAIAINILLAPFLIIGIGPFPKLGVAGSALATVIAQCLAFIMAIVYLNRGHHFLKFNRGSFVFDKEITLKTIKIGLPSSLQQSMVSLAMVVLQGLVNSYGPAVIAAYGVTSRSIDNLIFLPSMTLANSVSAFTGQNLGAGREDRVKRVVYWASLMGLTIATLLAIVVEIFPRALISIFTTDRVVIREGVGYLRIVALGYIPFSIMFIMHGVLRGAGDTLTTMFFTLFSLWLVRLPLAIWFSRGWSLHEQGIWMAIVLSSVLGMIITQIYYRTGLWKRKVVVR